jgi:glycosyltransferase involved in cell wall biosynthesis
MFMIKNWPDRQPYSPPIAAIVPAYNEAKRITGVLEVLYDVDLLSEIIVVDDGSIDSTAAKVKKMAETDARIRLIQHAENLGKGQAIFTASRTTRAPLLLLLDADLIGLTPSHIHDLIEPVLRQQADMSLGLFKGGRILTDFSHWIAPWLSGQRCLKAEILDCIDDRAAAGYGFETALTIAARQAGIKAMTIPMRGVWHPPSEIHRDPFYEGFWRLRMYKQIVHAWFLASGWRTFKKNVRKRIMFFIIIFLLASFNQERVALGMGSYAGTRKGLNNRPAPAEILSI